MIASDTITHQREAAFHDAWAGSTPIDDVLVRECFEALTAMENRFILSRMGDLKGKRLLDIGAGLGESSVYFALQGAQVTMTDISPGMVRTGRELARKHGVEIEGIVSQAEDLGVPAETYDFVYIANTIHHVQDRDALFQKIHRALKPGGRFLCLEFSRVEAPGLDAIYERYSFSVLPKLGEWVAQDGEAYRYLAESIRRFPAQKPFATMIEKAGLSRVKVRNLTGGIAAMHSAWRI